MARGYQSTFDFKARRTHQRPKNTRSKGRKASNKKQLTKKDVMEVLSTTKALNMLQDRKVYEYGHYKLDIPEGTGSTATNYPLAVSSLSAVTNLLSLGEGTEISQRSGAQATIKSVRFRGIVTFPGRVQTDTVAPGGYYGRVRLVVVQHKGAAVHSSTPTFGEIFNSATTTAIATDCYRNLDSLDTWAVLMDRTIVNNPQSYHAGQSALDLDQNGQAARVVPFSFSKTWKKPLVVDYATDQYNTFNADHAMFLFAIYDDDGTGDVANPNISFCGRTVFYG